MNRFILIFFVLLISLNIAGQKIELNIKTAGSQVFNHTLFSFGTRPDLNTNKLYVFKLNNELIVTDSLEINTGKIKTDKLLQLYSDTLHNFLNIYLQEKEKNTVTILRLNKDFKVHTFIENVEVARLNSVSMFSGKPFYYKEFVYSVRIIKDTTGNQFYLNKYILKSAVTNFDYAPEWQFPFDKKDIRSAEILHAGVKHVYVFVWRENAGTTTQWLLKINSVTGQLIRGSKINDKGETNNYQFGAFSINKNDQSVLLIGQKQSFTESLALIQPTTAAAGAILLYTFKIDSTGESIQKQDFKIPVTPQKGALKQNGAYILKLNMISERDKYTLCADVYSKTGNGCVRYTSSTFLMLTFTEDKFEINKTTFGSNPDIEQLYGLADKFDMNGRICLENSLLVERLYSEPPTLPVKLNFKTDDLQNPMWLLRKSETRKKQNSFYFVRPVKKIYKLEKIETLSKELNPYLYQLNDSTFVVCSETTEGKYSLNLYKW